MTSITINEIRQLTDTDVINLMKQNPYPSQWIFKDALNHAIYLFALLQGKTYMKTGNINSFKK